MVVTGRMSIERRRDGVTAITLSGELEGPVLTRTRQALAVAHAEAADRAVILDLSALTFIGTDGLRLLRDARRAISSTGGRLVLVPPPRHVTRFLHGNGGVLTAA